ncbi:YcdB/YcdC domain-containing protein [Desulfosporosinus lacus]|uniref:S-layer homology domain-containing protein n=1 Tax=Desulfosporosinus lacus DSM 15449 TaxID=1121420 RepID=A0A1M5YN22_9FIRM|nr:YcdB/YcdC domain-containing protein [Desulfosporosinus lacus]SHI13308.1 S-layer homology domain-containing protein [Desulfosporosinus lacus DSM 15449]
MKNNWRSFLSVIVVAILLVPTIFAPIALAGESSVSSPTVESLAMPEVSLEKAIQIVKTNFDVPTQYTDFSSSYNTYDGRQVWALRWNGTAERPGEFAAEVNAINGDIVSMNYWKNEDQLANSPSVPTITKAEAQEISSKLLSRLLGKRTEELSLIPSELEIVPLNYGPFNYSLQYQRLINGVPFLSNEANVQVSSTDGHITSYNLNWNDVKAPEVKGVISVDQAQQAFVAAPFFKLQYWIPASYRPLLAGKKQEAKLVYQLRGDNNGGAIDALTGLPLQLKPGEWLATDQSGVGGMGSAKSKGANSVSDGAQVLTPQEQQEVERTAKLLKQDEAIAAVKRWVEIPDNLTLRSANLSKDWRNDDKRIWSFEWSIIETDTKEGNSKYINARVSATTGELLGFAISTQQNDKTEVKLDRAAAQKLAEEFLKKVQPERFNQVVLDSETDLISKMSLEPWNNQAFSYGRVVNGVDFPENGMSINVDPVAGIVTNFELNWSEYDLPGLSGILSKDKAVESFLKARPLTLTYVRIYSNGIPGDLRLVYLPIAKDRSIPISNILDAKSGELLDYQGQPVEKGPKPYSFTDLAEVTGAAEITVLGQAGLFGDYENSFKPQEKMSVASMLRAMYLSRFGLWGNMGLSEKEVMNKAKELGWLTEDLKPSDPVNRELLAKVLMRYIQLNKLAELKDIYQVSFQDSDQISSDALGYVAIASSTGIIKVEGQVLAPRETVSRAEAATALFRALGWHN